jgi:hypothetical protein
MQSIMGPMGLTDNGLIKKYIMGSRDRVWGESLHGCVRVRACVFERKPLASKLLWLGTKSTPLPLDFRSGATLFTSPRPCHVVGNEIAQGG